MIGDRVTPVPNWVAAAFAGGVIVTTVVYVVSGAVGLRNQLRLKQAHNDLKWIGMALHQYHDFYGRFPPQVVYDDAGNPMHSWRSLIQPYFSPAGDSERMFAKYSFDERWDGPNNLEAATINRFNRQEYSFLAVVGPDAAWKSDGCQRIGDFDDGASNTILVIGLKDFGVGWHEPRDVIFDGQKLWLERDGREHEIDLSTTHPFVLTADGFVRYWGAGMTADVAKPLFTSAAGDAAPVDW